MRCVLALALVGQLVSCETPELTDRCITDDDCPSGLCNFVTSTCYPATTRPTLSSEVVGTFSCPYFAAEQTKLDGRGSVDLHLEHAGSHFTMRFGCGIWPKSSYMELVLVGGSYDAKDAARLNLLLHKADYRTAELKSPAKLWGWLFTQALNKPMVSQALAWGGSLTFTRTSTKPGEPVEGKAALKIQTQKPKPYSSLCRLKQPCPKGCPLQLLALASPDCLVDGYCQPLYDGSAKGFCSRHCAADADCKAHDPKSQCAPGNPKNFCLHSCATNADCETPLTCNPKFGCYTF